MAIIVPRKREGRITLCPAQVGHAKAMIKKMDPATAPNLEFCSEPITLKRQIAYLKRMVESPTDHLFVILLQNGQLVGTIGLHEHDKFNRTARLGRWIFSAVDRNQGYGAEAVFHLFRYYAFSEFPEIERCVPEDDGFPLHKIYVNLFTTNICARKYFKGLGFKWESDLEKEYFLRGEYRDMVRLRLLRAEWEKLQGGE